MNIVCNANYLSSTVVHSKEKNKDYYHCKMLLEDMVVDFQFISSDSFNKVSGMKKMTPLKIEIDIQEGYVNGNLKSYRLRLANVL